MISLLMPTRKRVRLLDRFVQSLLDTTSAIDDIELILCIDEDDEESRLYEDRRVSIKKVIVPPGLTMGALNIKCFELSAGDYIMLVNDDIILRTKNWDCIIKPILNSYKDSVFLLHFNDLLFREKMCTFPFLSRKVCLAIGVCAPFYKRYRIDDHIYDTFALLAHIGHRRIFYFEDVIFQHDNCSETPADGYAGQFFAINEEKSYVPNKTILDEDAILFDQSFQERKNNAVILYKMIETGRNEDRLAHCQNLLSAVADQYSCRKTDFIRHIYHKPTKHLGKPRVTIAVVTSNAQNEIASSCLQHLKMHTDNFDLIVLDNNSNTNFNHPKEMNKVLKMASSKYVVLMDDDVLVEPGWLEGMLAAMTADVGAAAPVHKNQDGIISFSGVYLMGDDYGTHAHLLDIPAAAREVQSACSAVLLIDMDKCGSVFFDERYQKYFLDIDYSLKIWETGYKLVVTPDAIVTHFAGATLPHGTTRALQLWNRDLRIFQSIWIETRRLKNVEDQYWSGNTFLTMLCQIPDKIKTLTKNKENWDYTEFVSNLYTLLELCEPFGLFKSFLKSEIFTLKKYYESKHDNLKYKFCSDFINNEMLHCDELVSGLSPILLETSKGYNIVEYDNKIYAAPIDLGSLNFRIEEDRHKAGIKIFKTIEDARIFLSGFSANGNGKSTMTSAASFVPHLQIEGFHGFNIIKYGDKFYGIPQGEGEFLLDRVNNSDYSSLFIDSTADGVKKKIQLFVKQKGHIRTVIKKFTNFLNRIKKNKIITRSNYCVNKFMNFNIYYYETKYFAIQSHYKNFEIEKYRQGIYQPSYIGNTVDELKKEIDLNNNKSNKYKALYLLYAAIEIKKSILQALKKEYVLTLLLPISKKGDYTGHDVIYFENESKDYNIMASGFDSNLLTELLKLKFDYVIIPYSHKDFWKGIQAEQIAGQLANRLIVINKDNKKHIYKGEDIFRIKYNKSYLNTMFQNIPAIDNKRILDVGCSDGLVCNLLLNENPKSVTGIDLLDTVGCRYPDKKITYIKMNAEKLQFDDNTFDVSLSIATMEHVMNPANAICEMIRVTKPGGYVYIQAGPLYYSPYGHHMFGYFDDFPWIHLRLSREEIIRYAYKNNIAKKIKENLYRSVEDYINGMLHVNHINGLKYEQYSIDEILKNSSIETLYHNRSWEGESALNDEILSAGNGYSKEDLTSHGFEFLIKKK